MAVLSRSVRRGGRSLVCTGLVIATALLGGAARRGAPIVSVGVLPGGLGSQVIAVSRNGSAAAGTSYAPAALRAFIWSAQGGLRTLGTLPGGSDSFCLDLSGNGTTAAGVCIVQGVGHAFRWRNGRGMEDLGTLPGAEFGAEARALSFNGEVVCGTSHSDEGFHAFRWTRAHGMEDLGTLEEADISVAYAMSADGSVVVGSAGLPDKGDGEKGPTEHGFRWTAAAGLEDLGALDKEDSSGAFAISADGSVITGYNADVAILWDGAGAHELGALKGGSLAANYAISGDGTVAGGVADTAAGDIVATLWTAPLGLVDLNEWLPTRGVDTAGWHLTTTTGLSHDGTTIVGIGTLNGQDRGWVVTLPRLRR